MKRNFFSTSLVLLRLLFDFVNRLNKKNHKNINQCIKFPNIIDPVLSYVNISKNMQRRL